MVWAKHALGLRVLAILMVSTRFISLQNAGGFGSEFNNIIFREKYNVREIKIKHLILKHPEPMFLSQSESPSFTTIQKNRTLADRLKVSCHFVASFERSALRKTLPLLMGDVPFTIHEVKHHSIGTRQQPTMRVLAAFDQIRHRLITTVTTV
ncbi:hypothetical protein ANN_20412 [Periplaneta americana]|uniref:Secreted protein n=1 Tax=Periplaneta americana TaxID=6978 RepID=A0ABQ8SCY2_PERAM|nr:hypothetical protein ANN_20412 [Periplaneta americana]